MHSDILDTITCPDFFNAVLLHGIHIQHTVSKTVAWGLLRLSSGSHTTNIQEYTARSQTDTLVLNSGDRSLTDIRFENQHKGDPREVVCMEK